MKAAVCCKAGLCPVLGNREEDGQLCQGRLGRILRDEQHMAGGEVERGSQMEGAEEEYGLKGQLD